MSERLDVSQIPPAVVEAAAGQISKFGIGFVALHGAADGQEGGNLGGSGTLVEIDGRRGILTAWHVLSHLPTDQQVGVIVPTSAPRLHRMTVSGDSALRLRVAYGGEDALGPDLGFLLLAELEAATLAASSSFVNLARRRDEMVEKPPGIADGIWIVWGFPDELTEARPAERGFATVRAFHGVSFAVLVERERADGEFDYIDLGGSVATPPTSFQGCSGGGLWQVSLRRRPDGELEVCNPWFSGVAFRESDQIGDHRTIICHGRRSVYVRALESIRVWLSGHRP